MEIVTILFAAAALALVIWTAVVLVRHYAADDQPVRLSRMLGKLGLSAAGIATGELADHLPTAARMCMLCGSTEKCEHVLAAEGDLAEPPDFCPNAGFIRLAQRNARQG